MNNGIIVRVCIVGEFSSNMIFITKKSAMEYLTNNGRDDKFTLSTSGQVCLLRDTPRLVFDSFSDFVANIESRIKRHLEYELCVRNLNEWSISWHIDRVEGYMEQVLT